MSVSKPNVICHAKGDRCLGCDHYQGKADECIFPAPQAEGEGLEGMETPADIKGRFQSELFWRGAYAAQEYLSRQPEAEDMVRVEDIKSFIDELSQITNGLDETCSSLRHIANTKAIKAREVK